MQKLITATLLAIVIACSSFAIPGKFTAMGVSFSYPAGWTITGQRDIDNKGYYVTCEKDGENSSGLITVTWVNQEIALDTITRLYEDQLEAGFKQKEGEITFNPATDKMFNKYHCQQVTYTVVLMGTEMRGTMSTFLACGKTITVIMQETTKDAAANKTGFKTAEATFGCK